MFLSPILFLWRKIIAKHETNDFVFYPESAFLFLPFDWRKIKEKIAEKRNFLDVQINFFKVLYLLDQSYK